MARTYEISFKLGAQMAGNFAKTMASSNAALGQLNDRIGDLNKQQSSIQSLVRLREQVGESAREYHQASRRVAELGREIAETSEPTREMTRAFEKAKRESSQARQKLSAKRDELRQLNRTMGTTTKSTADLVRRQKNLARSAEKARSAQAGLQKTMGARDANLQRRGEIEGQFMGAAALGAAAIFPLKIAADFEQQMAKVGAVSGATGEQLKQLTATARELGGETEWSATQAAQGMQYLSMAGFDAQQSIKTMPGMLDLASAGAVDLGSAADIASNVLTGFNMEADQMGRLGDVLTNTFTSSNTNLKKLGNTMSYVASDASNTGQSLETTAAMAGMLANNGIQGSRAGTAMRAMINRLASPSGEAATALENLGIKISDSNGDMRSMSAIMADMDEAMKGMGTTARQDVTATVFSLEAASAASILLGKAGSGELQNYSETLKQSGSAARVAEQQNDTAHGAMKRLASAAESIAITMGNTLLPTIATGAERFADIIGVVDGFAQQFPVLTKLVVGATAALIALRIATLAGGYAATFIKGAWLSASVQAKTLRIAMINLTNGTYRMQVAQRAAAASTKVMTAAQWLFNTALMANPIGLVVAAIGGLIAIGYTLYAQWDRISAFLGGVWQGIVTGLQPVLAQFRNLLAPLSPIADGFQWIWTKVTELFGALMRFLKPANATEQQLKAATSAGQTFGNIVAGAIKVIFLPMRLLLSMIEKGVQFFKWLGGAGDNALAGIANTFRAFNPLSWFQSAMQSARSWLSNFSLAGSGRAILSTLASGIRSAVSVPVNAVKGALAQVRDYLPFSDAKTGPLSQLTASGQAVMKTLSQGMASVKTDEMMRPFERQAKNLVGGMQNRGIGTAAGDLRSAGTGQGAGGGGMTVHLQQTISVGGGSDASVREQARAGASEGADEMIDKLRSAMNRDRRVSYG